ncbi:MAG: EF2563 family selenium-dependent molybdenum hydroxylase system protein [Clostridiales bacterium]|nr:EF2563 family selenium-dependent molybdenum hydroxylase system protein [Clostridiales bacterium]
MIIVRGGGDIATGTIYRLYKCGYKVLILETDHPTAIRRKVAFCEAVYDGTSVVEGVICRRVSDMEECHRVWKNSEIPLMTDPEGEMIGKLHPEAVIDAILAKKNLGTNRKMAPLTIALGPGFCAGEDVDYVIETMRGHRLGRIIESGPAIPNTGVPGIIGGYGAERVIHAPAAGTIHVCVHIGDLVEKGQLLAIITYDNPEIIFPAGIRGDATQTDSRAQMSDGHPVTATLTGVLRGMIRDGFYVKKGLKIADIDPRIEERENCDTISDKAGCIAGGVLEVLVSHGVYGNTAG